MDIEIDRAAFASALKALASVANKTSTMPVLANVLLRTLGKTKLRAIASDLGVTMEFELPCKVKHEGGTTLNARQLAEIIEAQPGETVQLKTQPDTTPPRIDIKSGRSKVTLGGLPEREYPQLPAAAEFLTPVKASVLRTLVEAATYCTGNDEHRPFMMGVHLVCDGKTAMMEATDAYRCVRATRICAGPEKVSVIIPKKGITELQRLLDTVGDQDEIGLAVHRNYLVARAGDTTIWAKLIEGQFANIDNFLHQNPPIRVFVPRQAFMDLVSRVSLVMSADGHLANGVKLVFADNALGCSAGSANGDATDAIEVKWTGKPVAIGVAARALKEALGKLKTDEVCVELSDTSDADPASLDPKIVLKFTIQIRPVGIHEDDVAMIMLMKL